MYGYRTSDWCLSFRIGFQLTVVPAVLVNPISQKYLGPSLSLLIFLFFFLSVDRGGNPGILIGSALGMLAPDLHSGLRLLAPH